MDSIIRVDDTTIGIVKSEQQNFTIDEINRNITEHEEAIVNLTDKKTYWEGLRDRAVSLGVIIPE